MKLTKLLTVLVSISLTACQQEFNQPDTKKSDDNTNGFLDASLATLKLGRGAIKGFLRGLPSLIKETSILGIDTAFRGAVLGPPGIIAGGMLGVALGLIKGSATTIKESIVQAKDEVVGNKK